MKCNRFNGDREASGNFLGSPALGDKLENLPLPGAEAKSSRGTRGIRKPFQVLARKTGGDVDSPVQDCLDCLK